MTIADTLAMLSVAITIGSIILGLIIFLMTAVMAFSVYRYVRSETREAIRAYLESDEGRSTLKHMVHARIGMTSATTAQTPPRVGE